MKKAISFLLCFTILFSVIPGCSSTEPDTDADQIDWKNIVLCDLIPAPQSDLMKIIRNDKTTLHVDVYDTSMNDFLEYIRLCEGEGFDIDATRGGSTLFSASNEDDFTLNLAYNESDDKMSISLTQETSSPSPAPSPSPESSSPSPTPTPSPVPTPSPTPTGKTGLNAEEIYAKCASAVFYVEVYDRSGTAISSGSGVFISADGKALTNHHVVKDAHSLKIMTNDGKVYNVSGYYDAIEAIDMALIQVDGSGFPHLTMGDSTKAATGQTIFAIGSPKGLDDTLSQGIISNANRVIDGLGYIQMTAPISSGSSGGALINDLGLLIGLNTAIHLDAQNLNLAVPIHRHTELSSNTLHSFPLSGSGPAYSGVSLNFDTTLELTVGKYGVTTISVDPGNCPEDVTVEWECKDESIASPEWDEWDDWDIDLYVYGESAGSTTITISLLTDNDVLLASGTLYVTVSDPVSYSGASLDFNVSSLGMTIGGHSIVTISSNPGTCPEGVTIEWDCADESIASPEWDEWDGWDIDLHVYGKSSGNTVITISLLSDSGVVLATKPLYVTVIDPENRSAAFNKLRHWITTNTNASLQGDPAYEYFTNTENGGVWYTLICDKDDNSIILQVDYLSDSDLLTFKSYLDPLNQFTVLELSAIDSSGEEYIFATTVLNCTTFDENYSIYLYEYEGPEDTRKSCSTLMHTFLYGGLLVVDSILLNFLPDISTADLGFIGLLG